MSVDTDRYYISEYDLAEIFGVSRRRIQQIIESAHKKIVAELGEDGVDMLRVMELAQRQNAPRPRTRKMRKKVAR
jgi:hypothetical protein